jgi:hypothetical protein
VINKILSDKPTKLFLGITAFFVANALIAECIGGKIFSLEKLFGINPFNFQLFWTIWVGIQPYLWGTFMATGICDYRYCE